MLGHRVRIHLPLVDNGKQFEIGRDNSHSQQYMRNQDTPHAHQHCLFNFIYSGGHIYPKLKTNIFILVEN